jgi:hypothetical protein
MKPGALAAMVCLVRNFATNEPQAVHRTALTPDGIAIRRNGKTFRMSLGPVSGGAIKIDRHSSVSNVLAIGEGVETCLAGRHYGYSPAWAMISDKGIESFPLMPGVERLLIFGDDDDAGKRASTACKDRWIEAGRRVGIVWPAAGNDLNDELLASATSVPRAEPKDTAGGCGALEFLTAVQGFWPGAAIVTAEENIEWEQFRKELAWLRAATQSRKGERSRGGPHAARREL